jgi:hypothetical protein
LIGKCNHKMYRKAVNRNLILDGFRNKTQHKHNKSVTQILHFDRYFAKKFKTNEFKLLFFTLLLTAISFRKVKEPLLER